MEANLRSRLVTASVGLPLLVSLVAWASWWMFAAVVFLLTVCALWEYVTMAFPGRGRDQAMAALFGVTLSPMLWLDRDHGAEAAFAFWLLLLFSAYLFLKGRLEERMARLTWTLLGALYVGYLLPHWVLLFGLPNGRRWVFFVLVVIMVGDSAAYFIGRRMGTTKLAPQLSPGKTVEGALAYLGGSLVAGAVSAPFLAPGVAWVEAIWLSGCLSVLGQIGDLFESWIKRVFAVKDSGTLVPGHGGVLDRLDSLIFPAVFTTAYLRVFHP